MLYAMASPVTSESDGLSNESVCVMTSSNNFNSSSRRSFVTIYSSVTCKVKETHSSLKPKWTFLLKCIKKSNLLYLFEDRAVRRLFETLKQTIIFLCKFRYEVNTFEIRERVIVTSLRNKLREAVFESPILAVNFWISKFLTP